MPAGEKKNQLSLMDIHWEKTYSKADPYSGETDEHGRTPYFWGGGFLFRSTYNCFTYYRN